MTDPPRLSELPEDDPARSLFGSLRDMPPPADLTTRTLASLGLPPPPSAASPPPAAPPPLAPSGASLLTSAALKPLATGLALLSLAGGAAHVALAPPRPAVTVSPASPRPASTPVTERATVTEEIPLRPAPAPSAAAWFAAVPASSLATGASPSLPVSASPSLSAGAAPVSAATALAASGTTSRLDALTPSPLSASEHRASSVRRDPVAVRATDAPAEAPRPASTSEALPPPLTAPVATPAPPSRPRLDLDRELAALDLARGALSAGSPARALDAIVAYRAAFPAGQLGAEALLLEIEARMKSGDRATAVQQAQTFLARHPRSVLAARVRSLAGLPPAAEANP